MIKLAERRILLLVITSALVLIYLIWWVSYAQTHQNPRYRQLAPGAVVSVKGLTVRLEQLIIADQLAAEDKTEPPAVPVSGAVWVVAQYQVSHRDFKQTCCNFVLVGANGATWSDAYPSVGRTLGSFYSSETAPYEFEQIFEVPSGVVGQLVGIAVEDLTSPARTPVLRPPR
jgi:hypothetical protein